MKKPKILDCNILEKRIRAKVIKEYLLKIGVNHCVCFTCGNGSKYLRAERLVVTSVGDNEELKPNHWFSFFEIAEKFKMFDATSGHLPYPLMVEISKELKKELHLTQKTYIIPTGSGETIVCLKMAFPNITFIPKYNTCDSTKFNPEAPLNRLVKLIYG